MEQIKPGVFRFAGVLSKDQIEFLENYAKSIISGLYVPKLKSGHSMNLKMVQAGKHWNAQDYQYYDYRSDVDNEPVPSLSNGVQSNLATLLLDCLPLS